MYDVPMDQWFTEQLLHSSLSSTTIWKLLCVSLDSCDNSAKQLLILLFLVKRWSTIWKRTKKFNQTQKGITITMWRRLISQIPITIIEMDPWKKTKTAAADYLWNDLAPCRLVRDHCRDLCHHRCVSAPITPVVNMRTDDHFNTGS